ncbi:hypothetical protein [Kitasatospora acidiphila]|uniref:hypothetical protein n=1 Tax=Kitasatospora acidiphila TaxID=2567942 RepID=UPI0011478D89|nr:hypothetical protein [Kitasatospora acidiphila]
MADNRLPAIPAAVEMVTLWLDGPGEWTDRVQQIIKAMKAHESEWIPLLGLLMLSERALHDLASARGEDPQAFIPGYLRALSLEDQNRSSGL